MEEKSEIDNETLELGLFFGDEEALEELRKVLKIW